MGGEAPTRVASASAPREVLDCNFGTSHSEMRQRSRPAVPDDAAVVENFLKLGGGGGVLPRCQICFSTNVGRVETGNIEDERNLPELN